MFIKEKLIIILCVFDKLSLFLSTFHCSGCVVMNIRRLRYWFLFLLCELFNESIII